jgi:putative transposase
MHYVTILTKARRHLFEDRAVVALCIAQFLRAAGDTGFEIRAYTFMPEHVHLLVQGVADGADFLRFMKLAKQLSGYHVKRLTGHPVWVDGYYERILRHDEEPRRFVKYILENPVKAGLASTVGAHPHTWAHQ